MMSRLIVSLLMLVGFLAQPALAVDEVTRGRITIPAGSTDASAKGTVKGHGSFEYLVDAKAGQIMTVKLDAANKSTYFNIWAPGKKPGLDEALHVGAISEHVFSRTIAETGDYLVQVYLYRNVARRNETSDFTLTVSTGSEAAPQESAGDFADGLRGGPDFWEVKGLARGRTVNLRREASRSAAVVDRLAEGTILRNKGCRLEGSQRWCNVERQGAPSISGWVAGQFLREAAFSEGAPPGDALVPGTNYHAVGRLPCTLSTDPTVKDCEFGVTRGSPGAATIFITLPNGFVRVMSFDSGKVSPDSAVTSFVSSREDDNTRVKVNGLDENYLIPDAIINGG